jgi:hypothetical protein
MPENEFPLYLFYADTHCGVFEAERLSKWYKKGRQVHYTTTRQYTVDDFLHISLYYRKGTKEEFEKFIKLEKKPVDTTGW